MGADPRILRVLEATPPGGHLWLSAGGRSMWPLLLEGNRLRVRRCGPQDLEAGDIAVVRLGEALVAHLVRSTSPLVTCGILGRPDPGGVVLGRVDGVRRAGVRVGVPRLAQPIFKRLPGVAALLGRSALLKRLVRRLRDS